MGQDGVDVSSDGIVDGAELRLAALVVRRSAAPLERLVVEPREVVRLELVADPEDHEPLNRALELSHVPRPAALAEEAGGSSGLINRTGDCGARACARERKRSASSGMSSRRARSGGTARR